MGVRDINDDYQPYLNALFEMIQDLKVPGRKAKLYEQMYVRTMFFEKCESLNIDGKVYDISNGAMVDMWNCKEACVGIYNMLESGTMDMECTFETYTAWKKDLLKACKEWDKLYVKHIKAIYPEMNGIHMQAMLPLNQLIESNKNFHHLEKMIASGREVPAFRHKALELEFSTFLTGICEIFREFGDLKDHFNIEQMIKTLKINNWKEIKPFAYYLTPINNSITKMRTSLLKMDELGPLRRKYIIENNTELQNEVKDMAHKDLIVQWLVGDELKQDQFKFFYDTVKIVYESALRDKLLANDANVIENVIPKLIAYRSIMVIREIQLTKAKEIKKAKEKAEREGHIVSSVATEEVKDPAHMTEEEIIQGQLDGKGESNLSEAQLAQKKEEDERKKYGRFWIWDSYFSEKNMQKWLDTAEALKHINNHVLQDIEDFILLEGFKGVK